MSGSDRAVRDDTSAVPWLGAPGNDDGLNLRVSAIQIGEWQDCVRAREPILGVKANESLQVDQAGVRWNARAAAGPQE